MGSQMRIRVGLAGASSFLFLIATCMSSGAQSLVPDPIHGVTVDDKNDIRDSVFLAEVLDSLRHLSVKPTVRIVYSPGNRHGYFSATSYLDATRQVKSVGYVFGQPVDSFYMKCFTPTEHLVRFKDYVTTLSPFVENVSDRKSTRLNSS